MKKHILFGLGLWLVLTACDATAEEYPREAYSHPVPGLETSAMDTFARGRIEFMQSWVVPPEGGNVSGLGPLFNRLACQSCHQKNGRGRSPNTEDERMLSMLVRLSVPGSGPHGSPKPHPSYGTQLNEEGVSGIPGEGRVLMHWKNKAVHFKDGTTVLLRKPTLEFVDMTYGTTDGMLSSPRVGQPVYGLGLLESVPLTTLQRLAAEQKRHGIHGSFNRVWDVQQQREVPGRFGWKANSPSLPQQMAEAFIGDMGVTSTLFPNVQCAPQEHACRSALPSKNNPELSDDRLNDMDFFIVHLAPPPRRHVDDPQVKRGERLFSTSGCAQCHTPQMKTADHPRYPATLPAQVIAPYSDLLLHDMGAGLADGRPDFKASGSQWRTPPLWGIGLVPVVNGHSQYLHDGRARNLEEAVVWHGGEASRARDRYTKLPVDQRRDLLVFLESL